MLQKKVILTTNSKNIPVLHKTFNNSHLPPCRYVRIQEKICKN